jgi:hypothetical protein
MRHKSFVANSTLSVGNELRSLVGEEGADLAIGRKSTEETEELNSSETVLLGRTEKLGIGNELGGGEFE